MRFFRRERKATKPMRIVMKEGDRVFPFEHHRVAIRSHPDGKRLTVDGVDLTNSVESVRVEFGPGSGALVTLRLVADLVDVDAMAETEWVKHSLGRATAEGSATSDGDEGRSK